jgi:predicted oxidoreductase
MCIGCHTQINPPGFAFENFNAVGGIRQMEGGVAVDTTGQMELDAATLTFRNAVELVDGVAASGEAQRCYVAKWLEFAYGRQFASTDQTVRDELAAAGLGATAIATRITTTPAFLSRAPNEVGP